MSVAIGRGLKAFLAVSSLMLCVAAQQPPANAPAQAPAQGQTPPVPPAKPAEVVATSAPIDPKSYIIGPEDVLGVRVWRENELSAQVSVRPDGKITLPLIGELQASGQTPERLGAAVAEALTKYLTKPQVQVIVLSVQSKKYFISGEVGRSGPVPLITPTTVLEALSVAGFKEWAKKKKIMILRGNERLKFNYEEVIKGKNLAQNIQLQNGDHIIVP